MPLRVRLPNPLTALDDRALLTRFASEQDQPAFEQLVKRHGALVYGVCKRVVRDQHLAEDAFQAVFLVLARNPAGALHATSIGGWLFGVARRVGLAARRHELRREKHTLLANPARASGDAASPDFDDLLRVLDEELTALPDDLRAALVACFLEEQTQDEAARELGWSLSTLRRRLERGKELLRSRLARRGVTLAAGLLAGKLAAPARAAVPHLAATPSPMSATLAREALHRGISAKLLAALAGVVLVAGGLAYGLTSDSREPSPPVPKTVEVESLPAPALAPVPRVEAKKWVSVSGRVVFPKNRALPPPKLVGADNIKDPDVWKPFMPLRYEDILIDSKNRGIANAVVFLRPDSDDRKAKFPANRIHPELARAQPATHTIFATAGQFTPRILAVRAGDRITFKNLLQVPTNVHYMETISVDGEDRVTFNILLGKEMTYTTDPIPASRHPDIYTSSIYRWMQGYVWAFDHPYYSVTDANGRFEIPNAPVGTWRMVVWHETVGYLGGKAGGTGMKLTISESRDGKLELTPQNFESESWPE